MIQHPIAPVYDRYSRVLVLGSFPSVKSRESGFFYGHPQNRFWRVLAAVLAQEIPMTIGQKRAFLLRNRIAVWDVIASCDIVGSSDSSIRNVQVNDLSCILETADIRQIITNGKKADALYRRYLLTQTGVEALCLPSTSPANAAWSPERLIRRWRELLPALAS